MATRITLLTAYEGRAPGETIEVGDRDAKSLIWHGRAVEPPLSPDDDGLAPLDAIRAWVTAKEVSEHAGKRAGAPVLDFRNAPPPRALRSLRLNSVTGIESCPPPPGIEGLPASVASAQREDGDDDRAAIFAARHRLGRFLCVGNPLHGLLEAPGPAPIPADLCAELFFVEDRAFDRQWWDHLCIYDAIEPGRRGQCFISVRFHRVPAPPERSRPRTTPRSIAAAAEATKAEKLPYGAGKSGLEKAFDDHAQELAAMPLQKDRAEFLAEKVGCSVSLAVQWLRTEEKSSSAEKTIVPDNCFC